MVETIKPVRKKIYYSYVLDKTIASTGETKDVSMKISSAHDFVATHLCGTSTAGYTVQIQDSGSNKNWFDSKMNNTNLIGSAQYPNKLPKPKFLRGGSTVTFFLYGSGAGANEIQIVLQGYEMPI